jgi:hypothetical protein
MASFYSTRILRSRVNQILVEHCPNLTIRDLTSLGYFDKQSRREFAFMLVDNRLSLGVHNFIRDDAATIEVQCVLKRLDGGGWQEIELKRARSRNARLPYRFVCPGRRLDNKTFPAKFSGCGKLVDTLYVPDHPDLCFLACRACHGLAYGSQRVSHKSRPRRARRRLTGFPPTPSPVTSHDTPIDAK